MWRTFARILRKAVDPVVEKLKAHCLARWFQVVEPLESRQLLSAPAISGISTQYAYLGNSVCVGTSFSDQDVESGYCATMNWGDGSSSCIDVQPSTWFCMSHCYSAANWYSACLTVSETVSPYESSAAGFAVDVSPAVYVGICNGCSGHDQTQEGATYTLYLSASTISGRALTAYTIQWGDGTQSSGTPSTQYYSGTVQHSYADEQSDAHVTATFTDSCNTSGSADLHVSVVDAPLIISFQVDGQGTCCGCSACITAGTSHTFTFTNTDADENIVQRVVIWGDGQSEVLTGQNTASHTYDGYFNCYSATVFLVSDEGVYSSTLPISMLTGNSAVCISYATSATEDQPYTISLTDIRPMSCYSITWGDGTSQSEYGRTSSVQHTFRQSGCYSVYVCAYDTQAGCGYNNFSVCVSAVNPTLAIGLHGSSAQTNTLFGIPLQIGSDPGRDVCCWTVCWGNGIPQECYAADAGYACHSYDTVCSCGMGVCVRAYGEDGTYTINGSSFSLSTTTGSSGASPNTPSPSVSMSTPGDPTFSWTAYTGETYRVLMSSGGNWITLGWATGGSLTLTNPRWPAFLPNTAYTFRVDAFKAGHWASLSNVNWTAPNFPLAPSMLSIAKIIPGSGTFSTYFQWTDNSSNESNFRVDDISSSPGDSDLPKSTSTSNQTCLSASYAFQPNTTYTFQVSAHNSWGDSKPATLSFTTLPIPAAPTQVSVTAMSLTNATLAWSDQSNNEDDFRLDWGAAGSFDHTVLAERNLTSFVVPGTFSQGSNYNFRVRAEHLFGTSDFVNTYFFYTNPPTGLTVSPLSTTKAMISWCDHSSNEDGYWLEWGTDGVSFGNHATLSAVSGTGSTGSATITGTFSAGTTYYFRIRVTNSSYQSLPGSTVSSSVAQFAMSGSATANEGTYSLSLQSPFAQQATWAMNWGNGTENKSTTGTQTDVARSFDGPSSYSIAATVTMPAYSDLSWSATGPTVQVSNVAPTATIGNDGPVSEGSAATVSLTGASDPSPADTAAGFQYSFALSQAALASTAAGIAASGDFKFTDDGTYQVWGRILDKDGGYSDYSTNVVVNAIAPTMSISGADAVYEGAQYVLTLGSVTEHGTDTVSQYVIHWGDTTSSTVLAADLPAGRQVTHTYSDPASVTITADLVDEDDTWTSVASKDLSILVPPSLSIAGDSTADEGAPYTLTITSTDPGHLASFGEVDWGDGQGKQTIWDTSQPITHRYAGRTQPYTIAADLTDGTTTWAADNNLTVSVPNVAPIVSIGNPPTSGSEGGELAVYASISDPGTIAGDGMAFLWTVTKDGVDYPVSDNTTQFFSFTPDDEGLYAITVDVTDIGGDSDTDTVTVNATGVAPTGTLTNTGSVHDGKPVAVQFTNPYDPSSADLASLHYSFALDSSQLADSYDDVSASSDLSASFTSADAGTYPVYARIIDDDGLYTDYSTDVVVSDLPPAVAPIAPQTFHMGDAATIIAFFTDIVPGEDHTGSVVWGDGQTSSADVLEDAGNGSIFASHDYTSAGTYAVAVTITDASGYSVEADTSITMLNSAPVLDPVTDQTISEGGMAFIATSAVDADPNDQITGVIDWGDSSTSAAGIFRGAARTAVSGSHVYVDDGVYTLTLTITDLAGATDTTTAHATVINMPPVPDPGCVIRTTVGTAVDLAGTFTDPGTADTFTYQWTVVDSDNQTVLEATTQDLAFTPGSVGTYTATFTVTDDDSASGSATYTIIAADPNDPDPTTPPLAPSNLTTVYLAGGGNDPYIVSPDAVSLSWTDNSDNEDGFLIEWSADGTDYYVIDTTGPNVTTYSDPYPVLEDCNYYRVEAYLADLESTPTSPIVVRPIAAPTVFDDNNAGANERGTLSPYHVVHDHNLTGINVLANDFDGASLPFWIDSVTQPAYGTVTISSDNQTLNFTPEAGFVGTVEFSYTATNGYQTSNPAIVAVDVTNELPVGQDASYNQYQSQVQHVATASLPSWAQEQDVHYRYVVQSYVTGTDADYDPVTYQLVTPPRGRRGHRPLYRPFHLRCQCRFRRRRLVPVLPLRWNQLRPAIHGCHHRRRLPSGRHSLPRWDHAADLRSARRR